MFRDLEQQQTSFTGIAAHRLFGANVAFHDQTAKIDGTFVFGKLLSGPRPHAGSGPPDRSERRSRAGRIDRRGPAYSYWELTFQAPPASSVRRSP